MSEPFATGFLIAAWGSCAVVLAGLGINVWSVIRRRRGSVLGARLIIFAVAIWSAMAGFMMLAAGTSFLGTMGLIAAVVPFVLSALIAYAAVKGKITVQPIK